MLQRRHFRCGEAEYESKAFFWGGGVGGRFMVLAGVVMENMFQVLKMTGGNLNVEKCTWEVCANHQEDIPQQGYSWDCGVLVCAYARCLVSKGKMMTQRSSSDFRKYMILELHSGALQTPPYSTRGARKDSSHQIIKN